jgi:hypothetical protein
MWETIHKYSRYVRLGKIEHLKCPDCNEIMAILDREGEPVLWCFTEDRKFIPGLDVKQKLIDAMEAADSANRT